jgi:hypothetical protein
MCAVCENKPGKIRIVAWREIRLMVKIPIVLHLSVIRLLIRMAQKDTKVFK